MFFKFVKAVAIFSIILSAIFLLVYYIGISLIWYSDNPFFPFLLLIKNHSIQTYVIVWSIGMILIFLYFWYKALRFIDELVEASAGLLDKDFKMINLSNELSEVEYRMNQIKKEAIENAELARINEQKRNDLIVYLTHDIKTPLTSVIGYLSLLTEEDLSKKQRSKYTDIALDKSYRLEGLINELFDITRFNSDILLTDISEININFLLEQIIDEFYPMLNDLNKQIILNTEEIIVLSGDSDKLGRAFNNIIKNALSYSNPESIISINLHMDDNNVYTEIVNEGKKIPANKLAKIFDKFYRADSSRTTATGGAGLGLAIAKDIVSMHNGYITVESDDKYTKFTVILPIHQNK
jgi:two-component system sensor histidine kinase VanS